MLAVTLLPLMPPSVVLAWTSPLKAVDVHAAVDRSEVDNSRPLGTLMVHSISWPLKPLSPGRTRLDPDPVAR